MQQSTWTVPATPDWGPLEALVPKLEDCAQWMHMGVVTHNDLVIQQYKHSWTRQYLNLDAAGTQAVLGPDGPVSEQDYRSGTAASRGASPRP